MEGTLGLKTETQRNDWMAGLKKKIDTGVQRAGELVTHKLELTQEEVEEWLAAVYEAREGIPFPAVKNYWPGKFDLSAKMNEQANALDPTTGTGTRYGMLITRVKHKLKFNLSLGASNVFLAAMAQQNNYICIGELTAKWRRLLSHSNFAMALKQRLGEKQFKQLKELLNLLDGAGIAESVTQQNLSGLMSRFQSAHAMAVLAGSPITLIKQTSAMLHAGAWEGINPLRVVWHLLKDRTGKGAITYGEIKEFDAFKVRHRDNRYFTEFMQLGRNANWSKLATRARTGLGWIEKMDIACNAASMTVLYNIKYEQLQDANVDAADPSLTRIWRTVRISRPAARRWARA